MKQNFFIISVIFLSFFCFACRAHSGASTALDSTVKSESRTYYMGFQNSAPRYDMDTVIKTLNIWVQRADAAIISTEVPWDALYSGVSAEKYITDNYVGLVDFYRGKNLKLWVYVDPANGLNRASDASALVARGKSMTQPDVQQLYREFTLTINRMLKPEHLGLVLETNLIRDAAPAGLYQGIKTAVVDTARAIKDSGERVPLSISVQIDEAWGKLIASPYRGIEQDFIDFPFVEELGLSSYPYFVFERPQDIPDDYYSRPLAGRSIPTFVTECGWSSQTVTGFPGTPEKQADYMLRQSQLLDQRGAIGFFQLTFTDIDVAALPASTPANLSLFAHLGLVDINLEPKPALATWDRIFQRKFAVRPE
jgi:hypothetical protein